MLSSVECHVSGRVPFDDIIAGQELGLLTLLMGTPCLSKIFPLRSWARRRTGELGSRAADVERYLGNVLDMGTAWSAAVLLGECDVFLWERSVSGLEHNVIVTVSLKQVCMLTYVYATSCR